MAEQASEGPSYQGPAFFSYGFRPFFLGAALFAGVAIPVWILVFAEVGHSNFLYPARDWHVHEMVFGFLPAVITGFLLTAIPNWTDRPPIQGPELMSLFTLWLAGRALIAIPWFTPLVSAIVDVGFLVAAYILFPLRWPLDRTRRIRRSILDCSALLHGNGMAIRASRVGQSWSSGSLVRLGYMA